MSATGDGKWRIGYYSNMQPDENGVIGFVFPDYDSQEHELTNLKCACKPVLEDGCLTHNAFDGRGEHTS